MLNMKVMLEKLINTYGSEPPLGSGIPSNPEFYSNNTRTGRIGIGYSLNESSSAHTSWIITACENRSSDDNTDVVLMIEVFSYETVPYASAPESGKTGNLDYARYYNPDLNFIAIMNSIYKDGSTTIINQAFRDMLGCYDTFLDDFYDPQMLNNVTLLNKVAFSCYPTPDNLYYINSQAAVNTNSQEVSFIGHARGVSSFSNLVTSMYGIILVKLSNE